MDFTVLTFAKIQFLGKWKRTLTAPELMTAYTPSGSGEVLVVTESQAGGVHTYTFKITAKQIVLVSTQENIIHLPTLCLKNDIGDTAKCIG